MMKRFQLIKIKADTPYQRGIQYGQQAGDIIRACIGSYKTHFKNSVNVSWEGIQDTAKNYVPLITQEMPGLLEEARGIAEGAGVDFYEIMALNCRYEILHWPPQEAQECTAFAVLPEAMADGKMIFGQNWDYRPFTLEHTLLLHITEEDDTCILGLAEAGQLLRNGFNSYGVGAVANSLRTIYDHHDIGIPVTFLRRKLLKSRTFEEAENLLRTWKRAVSNNYMVASGNGLAADFEVTPHDAFKILPKGGIITHANHMLSDPSIDDTRGKKFRGERLEELLSRQRGRITIEYLKECLKDHEGWPESICSHNPEGNTDLHLMWQTNASLIYDFSEKTLHLCYGPPCEGEYVTYSL